MAHVSFENQTGPEIRRPSANPRPRSAYPTFPSFASDNPSKTTGSTTASTFKATTMDRSTQAQPRGFSSSTTESTQTRGSRVRPQSALPYDNSMDPVIRDQIWTHYVEEEKRRTRLWTSEWGFTTLYDPLGRIKPTRDLPLTVSVYSSTYPNTTAGQYGSRGQSSTGQTLFSLQNQFFSTNRKRRTDNDLICY